MSLIQDSLSKIIMHVVYTNIKKNGHRVLALYKLHETFLVSGSQNLINYWNVWKLSKLTSNET